MRVSKTLDRGSIPRAPAKHKRNKLVSFLEAFCYSYHMNYVEKKSIILPLLLITLPTVILVLTFILNYTTDLETTSSTGDAYVDYMNSRSDEYVFNSLPVFEKIAKRPLSSVASISAIAIVPCFILGVIMLFKRRSIRH